MRLDPAYPQFNHTQMLFKAQDTLRLDERFAQTGGVNETRT